jgi:hypothetical protein
MSKIIHCRIEYLTSSKILQYSINLQAEKKDCPISYKQEYCLTYATTFEGDTFHSLTFKNKCRYCSSKYENIDTIQNLLNVKEENITKIMQNMLKISYLPIECIWTQSIAYMLEELQ